MKSEPLPVGFCGGFFFFVFLGGGPSLFLLLFFKFLFGWSNLNK